VYSDFLKKSLRYPENLLKGLFSGKKKNPSAAKARGVQGIKP
jgi:hypothetical protein